MKVIRTFYKKTKKKRSIGLKQFETDIVVSNDKLECFLGVCKTNVA